MDLAPVVRLASRHRRPLLLSVLLITGVLACGLIHLRVETGVLDWLPRNDPHVVAFRGLFDRLSGAVNQELLWLELDSDKARKAGVKKITDHKSLLAQEELVVHLEKRVPEIRGQFGVLPLLKAARAKLPGGGSTADPLPPSPGSTRLLLAALHTFAGGFVDPFLSEDETGTVLSMIYDAKPLSSEARDVGRRLTDALEEYANDDEKKYDLFRDDLLVPTGLASGAALIDRILIRDLAIWTPVAFFVLAFILRLVLGDLRSTLLVLGLLLVGTIWTLGLMGWCDATLNIVTIAVVPLVLGCGIDYAILVSVETSDRIAMGEPREAALERVGRSSATAVFLTTLTTAAGLLVLVFSDSPGMSALGVHAAAGMVSLALLAILALPLLGASSGSAVSSALGRVVDRGARGLRRRRVLAITVFFVTIAGGFLIVGKPIVLLDTVDGHYPPDEGIARVTRRIREKCGGAFPEIIIARGDMTRPESIETLRRIQRRIAQAEGPVGDFRTIGAPDLMAFARPRTLLGARRDAADLREAIDTLHEDPVLAPLAGMFISYDADIATILLLGGDPGNDPEGVERLWNGLETIVQEESEGSGLDISFLGYRTMAYLFSTYSLEWIGRTGLVSFMVVLFVTTLFLRQLRAVLLVGLLVITSASMWYVLIGLAGIYVSVFLLFPLVFIVCIGSDYGFHVLCRLRADRLDSEAGNPAAPNERQDIWATTGRAITLAAITDAVAFLIYAPVRLVSVSQVMIAVTLAVGAVFTTTAILMPTLARARPNQAKNPGLRSENAAKG
jgi:predicted RND superfamily exporter protein